MKKIIATFTLITMLAGLTLAQENADTSYWSEQGKFGLAFSQVGLTNWAAGGDPNISFNALFNISVKYEKDPHLWQTKLDAGYGKQRIGREGEAFKKTNDNLVLTSRYGYKIGAKWYASALADFRTQFTDGYKYEADTSIFLSTFMAPAYAKLGLGVTYNHKFSDKESFSFTFSPLNGKAIIVLEDSLSARGEYGVDPGENVKFKAGLDLLATLNKELVKNVTLSTTLGLFSQYTDLAVVDVNWDLVIWFKINEWLSANISTQMIYDQDVKIAQSDGTSAPAVQFKEVLGLGLALSF